MGEFGYAYTNTRLASATEATIPITYRVESISGHRPGHANNPVYSLVPSSILTSSSNAFVRNVLAQVLLCHDAAAITS